MRVEHEYRRNGVCAYIAAWDVHRARLFGQVVKTISVVAFDALVAEVIEIYFSILQRKAVTPADFSSQDLVADRILGVQEHYQQIAQPFQWKFTRRDPNRLVARWAAAEPEEFAVAA